VTVLFAIILNSTNDNHSASASNAASSALASNSAALSSVASQAASAASSLATGATQTGGAVPMMTGLPLAGAAGMAAWLLL